LSFRDVPELPNEKELTANELVAYRILYQYLDQFKKVDMGLAGFISLHHNHLSNLSISEVCTFIYSTSGQTENQIVIIHVDETQVLLDNTTRQFIANHEPEVVRMTAKKQTRLYQIVEALWISRNDPHLTTYPLCIFGGTDAIGVIDQFINSDYTALHIDLDLLKPKHIHTITTLINIYFH